MYLLSLKGWGNNMDQLSNSISIHFAPLIPELWLVIFAALTALLCLLGFWKKRKSTIWRTCMAAALLLTLSNPSLLEEERKPVKDVAFIIVDRSPSQAVGQRAARTNAALEAIQTQLGARDDLDLRIIESDKDPLATETNLFELLERHTADTPPARRAGVLILSDGQIHDMPQNQRMTDALGPVSLLLSGSKKERDRQVRITQAPAYGIVGQKISVTFRIEDIGFHTDKRIQLTIRNNNQDTETLFIEPNKDITLDFPINNAGQNIFEFNAEDAGSEITLANNKTAVLVNGVRDRLKVLLVSGQPHAGGRTWRDLLTSDPSVDLIHFTILREPNKLDATPQNELSLIAFPFRELFEIKLYDFDLIVFDRYKLNRILPNYYFNNIVKYVRDGGALLVASGPDFAGEDSVYYTSLMDILPAAPTGDLLQEKFYPKRNNLGLQHPVTRSLVWQTKAEGAQQKQDGEGTQWGPWLRQVVLNPEEGQTLMEGAQGQPLLILDRVEKGRIAQIASDHIWLWSRGYQGGGPYSELMRRIVHWLMKEPQLDEQALNITAQGDEILIKSIDLEQKNTRIQMTKPDGTEEVIELNPREDNILQTRIKANQLGIYSFKDGYDNTSFIHMGELNAKEMQHIQTTPELAAPLINASAGGTIWLEENERPTIRLLDKNRRHFGGDGWAGLRQNKAYTVEGVKERPLLPAVLSLFLLLGLGSLMWWREGR